jgi:hypothetical protein
MQKQDLLNEVEASKNELSSLQRTISYYEQVRKRKSQEMQNIIDERDRTERFTSNILKNDEGYLKLKQIATEHIKAILSKNNTLTSAAFMALLQTLRMDSDKISLIHNIIYNSVLHQKQF